MLFSLLERFLRCLDEERAHDIAILALRCGVYPSYCHACHGNHDILPSSSSSCNSHNLLSKQVAGLNFVNPLGMGAGFDKNAYVFPVLWDMGFGFVEVGTLTPKPQIGHKKPRLFRLSGQNAIINRYGFNNDGFDKALRRLERYPKNTAMRKGILGINIGPNKDSEDFINDYVIGIQAFEEHADYIAINISSPNTLKLRTLHKKDALKCLLERILLARRVFVPIFLKVSPDITEDEIDVISDLLLTYKIDGLIATNTTITRPLSPFGTCMRYAHEMGGMSGQPLKMLSNTILKSFSQRLQGAIPLIGVGGIFDFHDAQVKKECGASLVQIYSGFIYRGYKIIRDILCNMEKNRW